MTDRVKTAYSLAVSIIAAGIFSSPSFAQYSGPSEIGQTTVAEILKDPVDDQSVRLQGHLLRQTAHDKYVFSDGTDEIVAEIKTKRFAGQSVDEKMKVLLIGEVDTSSKRPPEIEVQSIRITE